ncbi:MAG TPA: hypothetical protein VNN17_06885 [Terriglobia bacterium]|nr:hypothetical protein [Terriglobia bacterium]
MTVAFWNLAHSFTHRVAHPLIFGCCPTDHPEQPIRAEWLSPLWWMRNIEEHFRVVREIRDQRK